MENIYVDMREQGYTLSRHFKNKDLVSVEDILTELEEVIDELENLQDEFEDYKRDVLLVEAISGAFFAIKSEYEDSSIFLTISA